MDEGRIVEIITTNGKVWRATEQYPAGFTHNPANGIVTGVVVRLTWTRTVTIPANQISGIVIEYANQETVDAQFARPV